MFKTWSGGDTQMAAVTNPSGPKAAMGQWHPTILYMALLVVAEIVVVGFLSRHLLK